ncbi:MAG: GNAT family N-acetyltransferase [Planctomycetaceae bacterium]|jgi:hypothetical protein
MANASTGPFAPPDTCRRRVFQHAPPRNESFSRIIWFFVPKLSSRLGQDRFAVIAAFRDGEIVGFVTVVRDRSAATGYYLGVDYDANAKVPVYHRLLFAVIEQAIRWRCDKISFGRTAIDAKARLGCQPEPTFVWSRHRIPMLNVAVKQLVRTVPHAEPPERNPFREQLDL